MKKGRLDIKKTIQKRLELRQQVVKRSNNAMGTSDERNKLRTSGTPKVLPVGLVSRDEIRANTVMSTGGNLYTKKTYVDYDAVICIPSHERYDKVKRLISQFYEQSTKYTFKIVLLNDGSKDLSYDTLIKDFPEIIYIKNAKPNGKIFHWYSYNQMWEFLRKIECHVVIQMDDDFIISNYFLNAMIDLFFSEKEKNNNMMAIAPHLWSAKEKSDFEPWWTKYNWFIDGAAIIDFNIIKQMNYVMHPVDIEKVSKIENGAYAWGQIGEAIKRTRGFVYRPQYSFVYHDGNDDSKLHPLHRVKGEGYKVYTQKFIEEL